MVVIWLKLRAKVVKKKKKEDRIKLENPALIIYVCQEENLEN